MDTNSIRYFINDKDQIRSIANPDQEFNFFISKNDRANDVQREAMNSSSPNTPSPPSPHLSNQLS